MFKNDKTGCKKVNSLKRTLVYLHLHTAGLNKISTLKHE